MSWSRGPSPCVYVHPQFVLCVCLGVALSCPGCQSISCTSATNPLIRLLCSIYTPALLFSLCQIIQPAIVVQCISQKFVSCASFLTFTWVSLFLKFTCIPDFIVSLFLILPLSINFQPRPNSVINSFSHFRHWWVLPRLKKASKPQKYSSTL